MKNLVINMVCTDKYKDKCWIGLMVEDVNYVVDDDDLILVWFLGLTHI